jgi:predicted DsbA family dithiol-disulfide isomerase
MTAVLYTDLNCPFCYATEERIEALGLVDAVEWRGIEHEPTCRCRWTVTTRTSRRSSTTR